jgi:hypothetical protein
MLCFQVGLSSPKVMHGVEFPFTSFASWIALPEQDTSLPSAVPGRTADRAQFDWVCSQWDGSASTTGAPTYQHYGCADYAAGLPFGNDNVVNSTGYARQQADLSLQARALFHLLLPLLLLVLLILLLLLRIPSLHSFRSKEAQIVPPGAQARRPMYPRVLLQASDEIGRVVPNLMVAS